MKDKFVMGKTYKFNPVKFMIINGIDNFYYNIKWILDIANITFKVDEECIYENDCVMINDMVLRPEWCVEMDTDVHYLGLIEDTYGSSVALYEDSGKFKTKHIKLFEEMLTKELTYK